MKFKDATSTFGRVGLLFPLLLIILIGADSAFACPGHKTGAVYRTKAINSRTISGMPATVITYRGPAASRRCVNNVVATRGARYVAVRNVPTSSARYVPVRNSGVRYVAVRNGGGIYKARQARYVAVRNADVTYAPRYMAVRRAAPVYIDDEGTRYVAERRAAPRVRYVAVRDIDIDDDDRQYVAVRRSPVYNTGARYVAVRSVDRDYVAPRTKYVAVRTAGNGCARAVALRSCLDDVETVSARRVVVRTDEIAGTQEVIVPNRSAEYVAYPSENVSRTTYVSDDVYSDGDNYVMASEVESPRRVVVRTYPEAVSTRTINYAPVADYDELDDEAILDDEGTTYVAANDVEDAYLRPVETETVSYVPVSDVDSETLASRSGPRYVLTGNFAPHSVPYVALDDDRVFDDVDPAFIAANGLESARVDTTASYVPVEDVDEIDTETVSYVPAESLDSAVIADMDADDVSYVPADGMETVSYVRAEEMEPGTVSYVRVDDMDDSSLSCVPAGDVNVSTVSYVPVEDIDDIDDIGVSYVPVDEVAAETVMYVPADDVEVERVSYVPVKSVAVRSARYVPVNDVAVEHVRYVPADDVAVESVQYVPVDSVDTSYIDSDACPLMVSSVGAQPLYVADSSVVLVEETAGGLIAGLSRTQRIAGQFGYSDGFEDGLKAAKDGDAFLPQDTGDYRKATEGYEDEFGDKDVYKGAYRESYLRGYRAGFDSLAGSV